jgi:antitoxin MazE
MTTAVIGRWGKSLALRLPAEIAAGFELREGERVEIEAASDQIVIRRSEPHYTLDEMFAGKSDAEWRDLFAAAYDWGPDLGQEVVDE